MLARKKYLDCQEYFPYRRKQHQYSSKYLAQEFQILLVKVLKVVLNHCNCAYLVCFPLPPPVLGYLDMVSEEEQVDII